MKLIAIRILSLLIGVENIPFLKLFVAKLFLSKTTRKAVNYDYLTGKVIKKCLELFLYLCGYRLSSRNYTRYNDEIL